MFVKNTLENKNYEFEIEIEAELGQFITDLQVNII